MQEHAELASSQMQEMYRSKTEQSTVQQQQSRSEEAREWQEVAQTRETRMSSSSNVVVGSSNISLQQFNVVREFENTGCVICSITCVRLTWKLNIPLPCPIA